MTTLTVASGTLFHLACERLGDATQWIRIAQLNGLADPRLNGLVTLEIPAIDTQAGGGIVQQ